MDFIKELLKFMIVRKKYWLFPMIIIFLIFGSLLILTQGLRKSTLYAMMGPYYYFGTFRKSVRYAGWTSTYQMREIDGNPISDAEGRYNRGTIIRFAVFVGEMTALLNHSYEKQNTCQGEGLDPVNNYMNY